MVTVKRFVPYRVQDVEGYPVNKVVEVGKEDAETGHCKVHQNQPGYYLLESQIGNLLSELNRTIHSSSNLRMQGQLKPVNPSPLTVLRIQTLRSVHPSTSYRMTFYYLTYLLSCIVQLLDQSALNAEASIPAQHGSSYSVSVESRIPERQHHWYSLKLSIPVIRCSTLSISYECYLTLLTQLMTETVCERDLIKGLQRMNSYIR